MAFQMFVGGYAGQISSMSFMPSSSGTGTLTLLSQYNGLSSPSWLAMSPVNSSILYANEEQSTGQVISFTIGSKGQLARVDTAPTGGSDPANFAVLLQGDEIVAANYDGASISDIMLGADRTVLPSSQGPVTQFTGSGPNASRQASPHPHQVYEYILGQELLVPDLGSDRTWRMTRATSGSGWQVSGEVVHPAGSGPRHCVTDNNGMLYTVHELSNTLTQHTLPSLLSGQTPQLIATLPTIPAGASNTTLAVAEVLLPKQNCLYPTQYLYISNRDDPNPAGDTVGIFSLNPLTLVAQVRTGIQEIRGMAIGGANGEYLVVGGQESGGVVVYERTGGGTTLTELTRYPNLQQVTTMVIVPDDPTESLCPGAVVQ